MWLLILSRTLIIEVNIYLEGVFSGFLSFLFGYKNGIVPLVLFIAKIKRNSFMRPWLGTQIYNFELISVNPDT